MITQKATLFSLPRLSHLIRYEYMEHYVRGAPSLLAVLAIFLVYQLLSGAMGATTFSYDRQLSMLLIFGSIWTASKGFSDLHSKNRVHSWLMLPASTLEKVVARILLVTLGYFLSLGILFALFMLTSTVMLYLVYRAPLHFEFGTFAVMKDFYGIFTLQSFFILGSLFFPKRPLAGTLLSIVTLLLLLLIALAVFSHAALNSSLLTEMGWYGTRFFSITRSNELQGAMTDIGPMIFLASKILTLPVLCMLIFLKVKKIQIHKVGD
jgi:hypothetical protein